MAKVRQLQQNARLGVDDRGRHRQADPAGRRPSTTGSTARRSPPTGGCVVVVNHVSHLDPMTLGWFLYDHGRLVRYLAKDALFRTPVLKYIVTDARQIPVARMTEGAASAFDAAVEAVNAGRAASASTPRARSPRTPTAGRCAARPAPPGSRWPPGAR